MTKKMKNSRKGSNLMGACPECDADIVFRKRPGVGQRVSCPECDAVLIVIATSPIELDWAGEDDWEEKFDR